MNTRGLVTKTVFAFAVIIGGTFIIIAGLLSFWFENYYYEQRYNQLSKQVSLIKPKAQDYISNPGDMDLRKQLLDSMSFAGGYIDADVILLNSYGFSLEVSNIKYNEPTVSNFLGKDLEVLSQGNIVNKKNIYNSITKEKSYIYAVPIFTNGIFEGAVVMYTPMKEIRTPIEKIYLSIWITCTLAIFVSCFIIYCFTKKIIVEPLSEINIAARKIARGEVERRVHLKSNDEIHELAQSFNMMADSLERVENNRREFISNVSHELRSPITSIKGFIGGVLDGVVPKDKEIHYLSIAYDEIQRLSRLVNELLDLSAIDAGKFTLRISEIDINEIVRLCVINCETKIKNKKLMVDVFLQDEHLYVMGDRDRIIQVITNLLDNAIKYVNDSGNIKITTKVKGEKVLFSIFNDGPSIDPEDLKHIWERFYKSDKSRTSKVSTGLGLPIVRSILTQHGEDIWAENKDNKEGVTFFFTLKKV